MQHEGRPYVGLAINPDGTIEHGCMIMSFHNHHRYTHAAR